jgi:hypothetical protein
MTHHDIDDLVRSADPYTASVLTALDDVADALFAEIVGQPSVDRTAVVRLRRARRRRSLRVGLAISALTAATVTASVGVPAVLSGQDRSDLGDGPRAGQSRTGGAPAQPTVSTPVRYLAGAVRVARDNPRVLVTAPHWEVRSVAGFEPDSGETTFQHGPDRWRTEQLDGGESRVNDAPQLTVTWYPRDRYAGYLADRAAEPGAQQATVLGSPAQLVDYSGSDHAVMLPPEGPVFLELRGTNIGDEAAFLRFLDESVEPVDVPTWLGAMPAEVVTAQGAHDATARVLQDIPLPPGFDPDLPSQDQALDAYQFGAAVTGAVTCAWIEEWQRARTAGDEAAAANAADLLATSHDWQVLHTMEGEGDFPEVVWYYADQVAAGQVPEGYREGLDCRQ